MSTETIQVKGAREHNLKNINIDIPRDKMVVITGISGSGKSTLAFDTIYAEGQRRYVESLSAYARQFLGQMEKPDVDAIEGLSPAISIDQKTTSRNPRSTVGTITEIYDYLRVLYARVGVPHCHSCGNKIERQTPQQIVDQILALERGKKFMVLAPIVRGRKGEYKDLFEKIKKDGFVRVQVDGDLYDLDEEIKLNKNIRHDIDVVVDRLVMKKDIRRRLADSVETALDMAEGTVKIEIDKNKTKIFSQAFACLDCGISFEDLSPRMFSFNSPYGACSECSGVGVALKVDPDLVVPDQGLSIEQGALTFWPGSKGNWSESLIRAIAREYDIPTDIPFRRLKKREKDLFLYGTGRDRIGVDLDFQRKNYNSHFSGRYEMPFEGIVNIIERRYFQTHSQNMRMLYQRYMRHEPCTACQGRRLRPESLAVTVGNLNIYDLCEFPVNESLKFFKELALSPRDKLIAKRLIKEIKERLNFLVDVGLDYITLNRTANTLSGGEAQRTRLATQIGSRLMGVLYILDEPTIGLHQRDNQRLITTLKQLRDLGNTLIVVEHDEEIIRDADYIIDIGPGAGIHGGEIVAAGKLDKILKSKKSITGEYLSSRKKIPLPEKRRKKNQEFLTVYGVEEHNLKNINVKFPLGLFICITGVSGSGKSTLVSDVLYKALARRIYRSRYKPGKYKKIKGINLIDKVIEISQSPIGRTPRSNPGTYTKVFDEIRKIFAQTSESRLRGYKPGRFSFNVTGGRCEACSGDGKKKIEMHFLPDVYITCEVCKGKRYNSETLEVKFKGKNIADILEMTAEEALDFFQNLPLIKNRLKVLNDVGLGYIKLGQSAPTLSGGEAQRVKLASELSKKATGRTLYILDEPTTGLHFDDILKLLNVLNRLVEGGNTVIVIEHHLDVIKSADYIIDLGPEGGDNGGYIVAEGSPEEIIKMKKSYTGKFLKEMQKLANG